MRLAMPLPLLGVAALLCAALLLPTTAQAGEPGGQRRKGVSGQGGGGGVAKCPSCDKIKCPELPKEKCPQGFVKGPCSCCKVCARVAGEPCGGSDQGRCALGYECQRPQGAKKRGHGECVCKAPYPVCGSDGITYSSACELRAADWRAQSRGDATVTQTGKGPCGKGPSIVTPPRIVWNVTGSQVYLSCEVIGIPTPTLTWNKIVKSAVGVERMELLPGDRDNLAIQTRGGPEKHEVTGWVLISPLLESDGGEYECHAKNSQGEAAAVGSIHVAASADLIPREHSTATQKEEEL